MISSANVRIRFKISPNLLEFLAAWDKVIGLTLYQRRLFSVQEVHSEVSMLTS